MSPTREAEGQGRSVDEAIADALARLSATRAQVEVEVVEEPIRGLFGLVGGRAARVRVRLLEADVVEAPAAADPSAIAEAPGEADAGDKVSEARRFVEGLLEHFSAQATIETSEAADGVVALSLTGERLSALIGKHGQTLDAVQYLVNVVANRRGGEWQRFVLDIDGYRERRARVVTEMAQRAIQKARQSQTPVALAPMSAHERRVVHMVVAEAADVESRSEGEDPHRRVIISAR